MPISSVISCTETVLAEHSDLVVHFDPPATEAAAGQFTALSSVPMHPHLLAALRKDYPQGFFIHQAQALQQILAGKNTVAATPTSSGKSLIYSVPVFDALLTNAQSTALFIYPQKALANDQYQKLRQFALGIPSLQQQLVSRENLISRYDGSTPTDFRSQIRTQVQVVLTNPDMLHLGILQYHDRHWRRVFERLRYVVIDECHEYRGIFGTNVAYLLRRLRQVCDIHGSSPTLVATSATICEPRTHMQSLTGLPFVCVNPQDDGSLQGRKKMWMVSSHHLKGEHYCDVGRKIALELADRGLSVLAFCPSRLSAERMMAKVQATKTDQLPFVKVYRAGLSAAERESIEAGLRDKSTRLVFSTNALELGIDIGAIDVVVCIGLPGNMMSLWQRAGRTARAGKEGAVILIPADTPIDSYYAAHPQEFLARETESLALNLKNRRLVHGHFACAVAEVGGVEGNLHLEPLGEAMRIVADLRTQGKINEDIFYQTDPHAQVAIRSMGEGPYRLQYRGTDIGEIDECHLLRESYRNAIYRHGGVSYRVKDVIKGKRLVRLEREFVCNETTPIIQKKMRLKRRHAVAKYSGIMVATVDVDVTEFIVSIVEKDRAGQVVRQWQGAAGMPAHAMPTVATQLLIEPAVWSAITAQLGFGPAKAALASTERLLASLFPTLTGPCDLRDFSSFCEVLPDESAAIYLYDNVYDGADLTSCVFDKIKDLITKSLERLQACDCPDEAGCFRCIANQHEDELTSKEATRLLLNRIQDIVGQESPCVSTASRDSVNVFARDTNDVCPSCHTVVSKGDRFCKNCGEKLT